jgi:hypothetical protein
MIEYRKTSFQRVIGLMAWFAIPLLSATGAGQDQQPQQGGVCTLRNVGQSPPDITIPIQVDQQTFELHQAEAGRNWVNWDPFFLALGQQTVNQWAQVRALQNQSGYADLIFDVNKDLQTYPVCYGAYNPAVDSIVRSLRPQPFPRGSQLYAVAVKYQFTMFVAPGRGSGRPARWRVYHHGEFNGKLYEDTEHPMWIYAQTR